MPLVVKTLQTNIETIAEKAANDAMTAMLDKLSGASDKSTASNADLAKEFAKNGVRFVCTNALLIDDLY